jgi:hypothetical protein
MDLIETIARWMCRILGIEPDELVRPVPAGPPFPHWRLYAGGAREVVEMLRPAPLSAGGPSAD